MSDTAPSAVLDRLFDEVVREQAGDELAAALSALPAIAGAARLRAHGSSDALRELIDGCSDASALIKACTMQLGLADVLDELDSLRRRRERPSRGPLAPDAQVARTPVDVRLVLTAHPTDITRRSILASRQRVSAALDRLTDPRLGPSERRRREDEIREALAIWWQTNEVRGMRPRVADEVRRILFFIETALYEAAGELAHDCARAATAEVAASGPPVRFGSWAGADMDGNPHVDADTLEDTLVGHRTLAIRMLAARVLPLRREFSQHEARLPAGDALRASLRADEERVLDVAPQLEILYPDEAGEPIRRKLAFIAARLERTAAGDDQVGYAEPGQLIADLELVRENLGSAIVAGGRIDRLIAQTRIFGFHLATLEARENAPLVQDACRQLLPGYAQASDEEARIGLLTEACLGARTTAADDDLPRAARTFDAIATGIARYGPLAIDTFVLSNAEQPSDVLCALWLAHRSGLFDAGRKHSSLDLVPLFERRAALGSATQTMSALYANAAYAVQLEARDRVQEVMLGYSDAGKETGLVASQWTLYATQERLARHAQEHGVQLRLFHGRGGSAPRGGGPAHRVLHSQPPGTVRGQIKITEQGEVIRAKFAHRALAVRALEQTVVAVARASALQETSLEPAWRAEMDRIANASRLAYTALVDDPHVMSAFAECTPIDVFDKLNIGSRPATRKRHGTVHDLRAIPWVFAWSQTRLNLPGWYGAGTALTQGELGLQREMWERWPFFRHLVTTLEKTLAVCDLAIGARYLDLISSETAGEHVARLVRTEYGLCVARVQDITGRHQVQASGPAAPRRQPWLDVLAQLQVDLMRRHRDGDVSARKPLLATVVGIATGLGATG